MHQLIYQSTSRNDVKAEDFQSIAEQSQLANRRSGISGILMVQDRTILQILEGEQAAVRNLYDKISADPRHQDCHVILKRETEAREFGMQPMAFRPVKSFNVARFRMTVSALKARQRSRIREEARAMIAEYAQIA